MSSKYTVTFDYDPGRRQAIVRGDHFDEIREHFSVSNDAAKFARYRNRFTPSRKYVITPQGRFDPGLYFDIRKFIKENSSDTRCIVSESLREIIKPGMNHIYKTPRPELALKLRDYQKYLLGNASKFNITNFMVSCIYISNFEQHFEQLSLKHAFS